MRKIIFNKKAGASVKQTPAHKSQSMTKVATKIQKSEKQIALENASDFYTKMLRQAFGEDVNIEIEINGMKLEDIANVAENLTSDEGEPIAIEPVIPHIGERYMRLWFPIRGDGFCIEILSTQKPLK